MKEKYKQTLNYRCKKIRQLWIDGVKKSWIFCVFFAIPQGSTTGQLYATQSPVSSPHQE